MRVVVSLTLGCISLLGLQLLPTCVLPCPLTSGQLQPTELRVHDMKNHVMSASDEEQQKKSQKHMLTSILPKFIWIKDTRKRKRKGFHKSQSPHIGSFVPQNHTHRHDGSLHRIRLSVRERLKNSRNRRHTHGSSRAHLMRVGCNLGTCQVQNLSHRLWQLIGHSGREDSAPINPNSPLSYG